MEFDQKSYKLVKVGDAFKYKVDGDEKTRTGKIVKIYPRANIQNRKVSAEVRADDLLAGLFGDGYISDK